MTRILTCAALLATLHTTAAHAQERGADDSGAKQERTEAESSFWSDICVPFLETCAERAFTEATGTVGEIALLCAQCFSDDTEVEDGQRGPQVDVSEQCSPEGSIANLIFTHFDMANPGVQNPHFNAVGLTTALTGIAGLTGAEVSNSDLLGAIPDQMAATLAAYNNRDFARFGALLRVTVTWDVCTNGAWTAWGPATFDLTPPASQRSPAAGRFGIPANTWSPQSVMGLTDGNLSGADAQTLQAMVQATESAIQSAGQ